MSGRRQSVFGGKLTTSRPPTHVPRNREPSQVEAVYLALAAEAAGGGETAEDTSLSLLPRKISGKKRARVDDADAAAATFHEDGDGSDRGETSDGKSPSSIDEGPTPAKARSLLHATISRYFDEGVNSQSRKSFGGTGPSAAGGGSVSDSGDATADSDLPSMSIEGGATGTPGGSTPASATEEGAKGGSTKRDEALPHQPLDKRACEVLVRDASVLVTDPSFQGRLDAGFDDGFGSGGGGLGYFDVATGTTAVTGGGGGMGVRGMAPHSWLLKVSEDLLL